MQKFTAHLRVLVLDGARALILRNEGTAAAPDLKLERDYAQDNPPTHDQGTAVPGRVNDSMGRRSAMETTDWHQVAEDRFVERLADEMAKDLAAGVYQHLVVVAPPIALSTFRKRLQPSVRAAIILEIDKDLTKHPAKEITKLVAKALEAAPAPR